MLHRWELFTSGWSLQVFCGKVMIHSHRLSFLSTLHSPRGFAFSVSLGVPQAAFLIWTSVALWSSLFCYIFPLCPFFLLLYSLNQPCNYFGMLFLWGKLLFRQRTHTHTDRQRQHPHMKFTLRSVQTSTFYLKVLYLLNFFSCWLQNLFFLLAAESIQSPFSLLPFSQNESFTPTLISLSFHFAPQFRCCPFSPGITMRVLLNKGKTPPKKSVEGNELRPITSACHFHIIGLLYGSVHNIFPLELCKLHICILSCDSFSFLLLSSKFVKDNLQIRMGKYTHSPREDIVSFFLTLVS